MNTLKNLSKNEKYILEEKIISHNRHCPKGEKCTECGTMVINNLITHLDTELTEAKEKHKEVVQNWSDRCDDHIKNEKALTAKLEKVEKELEEKQKIIDGFHRQLSEAFNSGDGTYRP